MFGNNKEMTSRPDQNNRTTFDSSIANRINKGTVLEGEITSETDIRIEGKIKGIINCKAKVVIGESGEFEGNIVCNDASIEGKVKGKLEVNGIIFLKKTSCFEGELVYKKLVVEEGSVISGTITMSAMKSQMNTGKVPIPEVKKPVQDRIGQTA